MAITMKAILVDDELTNLENLHILLEKYCKEIKIVGKSHTVADAAVLIDSQKPDLVFLDIQMGTQSGFDLLNMVEERTFEVIFVTAFDKYGIQAVKFAALDYLLKPVNPIELVTAVSKAQNKVKNRIQTDQVNFLLQQLTKAEKTVQKIALPQQYEIRYLAISDILRCEADNTYTLFLLMDGDKILVSKPLKEYSDLLKPHGFLRTHQSHLVNPEAVKSWLKEDGGMLLMNNGDKVPVSKPHRDVVKGILGQ
jgi:two-component system LytT family response regulator